MGRLVARGVYVLAPTCWGFSLGVFEVLLLKVWRPLDFNAFRRDFHFQMTHLILVWLHHRRSLIPVK